MVSDGEVMGGWWSVMGRSGWDERDERKRETVVGGRWVVVWSVIERRWVGDGGQ